MRLLVSLLLCFGLCGPLLARKAPKLKRGPAAVWGSYKQPKAQKWKQPKAPKQRSPRAAKKPSR